MATSGDIKRLLIGIELTIFGGVLGHLWSPEAPALVVGGAVSAFIGLIIALSGLSAASFGRRPE